MTIGIVVIHIADTTDGLMGVGGYGDLTLSLLSFAVERAGGLAGGVGCEQTVTTLLPYSSQQLLLQSHSYQQCIKIVMMLVTKS